MRNTARSARRAISAEEAQAASAALLAMGLQLVNELRSQWALKVVSGYYPVRDELNPLLLLQELEAQGMTLALPVTIAPYTPLLFRQWRYGAPLNKAQYGLLEPSDGNALLVPDLVMVPLLAFDARGHRLGYGAGHYDATLRTLRATHSVIAVGLAYETQQVSALPCEPQDERLDYVVTPKGVMCCKE